MVLKRKRGNEWVTVTPASSQPEGGVAGPSSQPIVGTSDDVELLTPGTKRSRRALPKDWLDDAPEPEPEPVPTKRAPRKPRGKAASTSAVEPPTMPSPSTFAEAGPSSSAAIASSSSQHTASAKRGRKKKDPNEPVPEKRQAMFKKHCPQNIQERLERVRTQRYAKSLNSMLLNLCFV